MAEYDPYETLGLKSGASYEECRRQYQKMVKRYHPDRNPSPEAAEYLQRVKHSWDYISRRHRQYAEQAPPESEYPTYYNNDGTMKSNSARQSRANPYRPGRAARRQAAMQKKNRTKPGMVPCTACDGLGYTTTRFIIFERLSACRTCQGEGRIPGSPADSRKRSRRLD